MGKLKSAVINCHVLRLGTDRIFLSRMSSLVCRNLLFLRPVLYQQVMPQPFTALLENYKTNVFDELNTGMFGTDSCISLIMLLW